MKNRRSAVVGGLAAVCLLVLLVATWSVLHRSPAPDATAAGPQVPLATARVGRIDMTVDAVGRVGPSAGGRSRLAFAQSGIIASVDVHVGQRVAVGEALATLDDSALTLAQRQAAADATAARAQARAAGIDTVGVRLSTDRAALSRQQRLYAAGVAARKDVEAARAQVAADTADAGTASANRAAAEAQAVSASARAALAQLDAARAVLRAPTAGTIVAIYRSVGESVDPSVAVVGLAPPSTGEITLQVTAADAARIASGDRVALVADGSAQTFRGTVVGVANAVDAATQIAEVSVRANVPLSLAGSAVSARIVVARDRGVIVPHEAIVDDPQTGGALVFVHHVAADGSDSFVQRRIVIVFDNGTDAVVTGLNAGEHVAARGAFELLAPSGG